MQSTLEETGKHTVRLTVEIAPEEFGRDLDRAYRHVAEEVKVPGFRKGKIPKRVLDVQVGKGHVLEHFLRDSLPVYYLAAVREHELAPISDPEFDLESVEDDKPLRFTATVEVRPRLDIDDYRGVRVDMPSTEVSEADVDEQIDRLRERFAELSVVSHPARRGDYVIADIRATVHGEEIAEVGGRDLLYEVGSEGLVPQLDTELDGKRAGEILKFNATLPEPFGDRAGQEVTFQVLVKEIKEKVLPKADDEFATTASEFDTIEELRADLRTRLAAVKEVSARAELRDLVLRELINRVQVDLPDSLVDAETERRVQSARERAERQGITLEQVLQAGDSDELRFRADARAHAVRALLADLVLEAVARREGLQVADEELDRDVRAIAEQMGRSPKEVRRLLERSGQITELAGDIIRSKALDLLVEHADVVGGPASQASEPEDPEQGATEDA